MIISLKNKTAMIFGASSGIGRACAIQMAESGASIIAIARREELLKSLISSLKCTSSQKHSFITTDMSDSKTAIDTIKDNITDRNIDILVNNTGGPAPGKAHEANSEDFSNAFEQHILMARRSLDLVLPYMKKNQFGRIINIISVGVKQPVDNLGVSNTIRGAMASFAKTLSKELGQYNITVNNLLPGFTHTERLEQLMQKTATMQNKTYEEIFAEWQLRSPIPRFGKAEELAWAATFLASDFAGYINGINLPVDGGFLSTL